MRTLYLDCGMGAAGDMLTAALLELIDDREAFIDRLNKLNLPKTALSCESVVKYGISGTLMHVKIDGSEEESCGKRSHPHKHGPSHDKGKGSAHCRDQVFEGSEAANHHHTNMNEISRIIGDLPVSEKVKSDVLSVYALIAEAESRAHMRPAGEIHFHEVGMTDAIADITAVSMLMETIDPEQVIVSPIRLGYGSVRCAHGLLPVPAPATAFILKNVPVYGGDIEGELCTPTGAALLKHFATGFGGMPLMETEAIGYGMGKKDFGVLSCVRAFIGESLKDRSDTVSELCCNLDDMTPEEIGFAADILLKEKALDVCTIPVQMKKSRPGVLLCVLCRGRDKNKMISLIMKHTSTLGIRENICRRYTLSRSMETVKTQFGAVRKKTSEGYGVKKEKYEYDDTAKIAEEMDISLREAKKLISVSEEEQST